MGSIATNSLYFKENQTERKLRIRYMSISGVYDNETERWREREAEGNIFLIDLSDVHLASPYATLRVDKAALRSRPCFARL